MRAPWGLPLVVISALPLLVAASFENTAIVRNVELGGALVHVTTTYAVRALSDKQTTYTVALSEKDNVHTSWLEAKIKGQKIPLELERVSLIPGMDHAVSYHVKLPKPLAANETTNIVVETVQTHATWPWPKEAKQNGEQLLKYDTDLFVVSPYHTAVQRTKIRSPTPKILSFSEPSNIGDFTKDAPATKSGATVTYGPYSNIPASTTANFARNTQQTVTVHFGYDHPILEVRSLRRAAEISHWGANLNIQDDIHLYNAGPALKGHFSRLEHQTQKYFNKNAPAVLSSLSLHLPAGIRDAYFTDIVGNVSTSKLRVAQKGAAFGPQHSILELRPRYPILGGWNYTFTMGWDAPLQDSAVWDKEKGKHLVAIPIMTLIPGAVVNDAEVKVILPEAATDVEIFTPFPPKVIERSTHVTYLDSVGRPAVTFSYEQLTDKHEGVIYVAYKVPFTAHLKKPVTVTAALFTLFIFTLGARRVELSLTSKKMK